MAEIPNFQGFLQYRFSRDLFTQIFLVVFAIASITHVYAEKEFRGGVIVVFAILFGVFYYASWRDYAKTKYTHFK